jgi:IS30 family transposase
MVGMKAYSHLSLPEREFIHAYTARGESSHAIAQRLGRDHSTVLRELKHNAVENSDTLMQIYSPLGGRTTSLSTTPLPQEEIR